MYLCKSTKHLSPHVPNLEVMYAYKYLNLNQPRSLATDTTCLISQLFPVSDCSKGIFQVEENFPVTGKI